MEEVVEQTCLRLKKEDVGYLATYYATNTVVTAAERWKRKSVTIVSPKSGRILRQNKTVENNQIKTEQNVKARENGFFSRIFEDFKKAKVSDFTYKQPKVRQNSSYKPFWATKTMESNIETKVEERETPISKTEVLETLHENSRNNLIVERNNGVANKNFIFVKEAIGSPKVILTDNAKNTNRTKKLSLVDQHSEYKLKMPPNYRGSKMFMPTGEQLFWVCSILILFLLLTYFEIMNC